MKIILIALALAAATVPALTPTAATADCSSCG